MAVSGSSRSVFLLTSLFFALRSCAESTNGGTCGEPPYNAQCSIKRGSPEVWNDCITMFRLAQFLQLPDEAAWKNLPIDCSQTNLGYCVPLITVETPQVTVTEIATVTVTVTSYYPTSADSYGAFVPRVSPFIGLSDYVKKQNDTENAETLAKRGFLDSIWSKSHGHGHGHTSVILSYGQCNAVVNRQGVPKDPRTGELMPLNLNTIELAAAQVFKKCALDMIPEAQFRKVSSQVGSIEAKVDLNPELAGASKLCIGRTTNCI